MQSRELTRVLAVHKWWSAGQLAKIEWAKSIMIGKGAKLPRTAQRNAHDTSSMGWWDAYRRATMLEPLAADIFRSGVEGDFAECGVFRGGISLVMAVMLKAAGHFAHGRRMWLADAFAAGMPPLSYTKHLLAQHNLTGVGYRGNVWAGAFTDSGGTVNAVSRALATHLNLTTAPGVSGSARQALEATGVYLLPGYLGRTLPTASITRLSLLRVDVDGFAGTYEALQYLYPRLSVGGYAVFDDWKIYQSQQAVLQFRKERNITTPIFASRRAYLPPMQTIDCMAYWRKHPATG
mmetsp:Transcript_23160/g.68041  ORF Transcript_23160/g.68041 Transcript_23160/m.68041 type:complete len:292 (+) Transcript_23160:99-974(+)